jgi:multicomponent K+:H+ antiporter subunit E
VKRLLPYPLLWLALLGMWLALNSSIAPGHLLLGAAIATLACWTVVRLEPPKPRFRKIGTIIRLIALVVTDIVNSNIAVIKLVLSGRPARSRFVLVPLELSDPNGLAILACIVTATPGSAWIHHDSMLHRVTIHVLDTEDEAAWNAALKRNYEQRLMEIFE